MVRLHLPLVSTYLDPISTLGDPTRRAIFELLGTKPRAVGELARELPVTRPAVSQHLRVLRQAQLVTSRAEGTRHIYALDPAGLRRLRAWLDRFWDAALHAYADAAAAEAVSGRTQEATR
jgi:DNA-binding transcriptional ArsR family regulator